MIDEIDSDCPECKRNVAAGDCACDGEEQVTCGIERFEWREYGRERASRVRGCKR